MSGAAPDLIAGYLEELYAGLRVPTADAELIAAEAEDHLRETAAAGMAVGMTELEAQQAAISSFGPVRAVIRAHRRRTVTPRAAALAAWKLTGLLATTIGAGGLAGLGIFAYLMRSAPPGPPPGSIPAGTPVGKWICPYSCYMVGPACPNPVQTALFVYAAMAAGGVALLVTRWLARRGTRSRDPLSPAVTASCFLLASALLAALVVSGAAVLVGQAWRELDHPDLGGLRLDRSSRAWCRRRRLPGGGRRLQCPGGVQASQDPAAISCARSAAFLGQPDRGGVGRFDV